MLHRAPTATELTSATGTDLESLISVLRLVDAYATRVAA
jgi:hypothetical protein